MSPVAARVFLDANVLFSAAYREGAGLLRLWNLPGTVILSSAYAAEEARRNLDPDSARARLERLLEKTRIVPEAPDVPLRLGISLAEKDRPILQAAIASGATHLLTGDLPDFGHVLDRRVGDVKIQTPGEFLRSRR